MISATDAAALYEQPAFTPEEVEAQIRRTAKSRGWTCFDKTRLVEATIQQLTANGFTVSLSGSDYIVSWEKAEDKAP